MKQNIFDLTLNRGLSVVITATAISLAGSFEAFYPVFLAFTLAHVLLAFYYSYPRFRNLANSRQSFWLAGVISLIGAGITFWIFPSIGLIFIIHEVCSQVFVPLPENSPAAVNRVSADRWVQVLRFFAGFFGLCYLARASNLIFFKPTPEWILIFVGGLILIFLRVVMITNRQQRNLPVLLNVFSFEWMLLAVVLFSYQFQFACTASHIAFYHVFFWFFLTLKDARASQQKDRYKPIWLHLGLMMILWAISPFMTNSYANFVLLMVCVHIFTSFYLSKYNPEFLKQVFYRS